ncbi:MAG: recombinase family protein [Eubacteriales bacterium]
MRYLAIGDNYDSNNYLGTTGGMEQALRNIVYASYPKMISRATKSGKEQLMKKGKFVGGYAPFGYELHSDTPHTLFIDKAAATTVRMIFDLALEGKKTKQIADLLNEKDVMLCSAYFRKKYPDTKRFSNPTLGIKWTYAMVHGILTNYIYTGSMVSQRRKTIELGNRNTVKGNPIIVENTHEAIVTMEEFEKAQKVISKVKEGSEEVKREKTTYPLKSLVRCGNCKLTMTVLKSSRHGRRFSCIKNRTIQGITCKREIEVQEKHLEALIYSAIENYVRLADEVLVKTSEEKQVKKQEKFSSLQIITTLEKEMKRLNTLKMLDYEKFTDGEISREVFLEKKAIAQEKIDQVEQEIHSIKKKQVVVPTEFSDSGDDVKRAISLFHGTEELTPELAQAFVKSVYVYDYDKIEIDFHFKDLF